MTSLSTALSRSSNSPRYLAPAISAPRSSATSCLFFRLSGTSPLTMRCASPSTMAVLPTPGSPISTGLFLVRRDSTWIVRRISSSRPMTGSSLPSRAASVRSRAYFFERVVALLGRRAVGLAALAHLLDRPVEALRIHPRRRQRLGRAGPGRRRQREQQPLDRHKVVAGLLRQLLGLLEYPRQLGRHIDLPRARPFDLRQPVELRIDGGIAPPSDRPRRRGSGWRTSPSGSSSKTFNRCSGVSR